MLLVDWLNYLRVRFHRTHDHRATIRRRKIDRRVQLHSEALEERLMLDASASFDMLMVDTGHMGSHQGPLPYPTDVLMFEGGTATAMVSVMGPLTETVTVILTISSGDLLSQPFSDPHTLTFGPGNTTQSFSYPVPDNSIDELTRTVHFAISPGVGTTVSSTFSGFDLRVLDDDWDASQAFTHVVNLTVPESIGNITDSQLHLDSNGIPVASGYGIEYQAHEGTAKFSCDFASTWGWTILPSMAEQWNDAIPIVNDPLDEDDETFTLDFMSLDPYGSNACASVTTRYVVTITDNDPPPQVTITSFSGPNINEGMQGQFVVSVLRSSHPITLTIAAQGGTATSGADYTPLTTTINVPAWAPGDDYEYYYFGTVYTNDDMTWEPNETFNIHLASAVNAQSMATDLQYTIVDNDIAPLPPTFNQPTYYFSINELAMAGMPLGSVSATSMSGAYPLTYSGGSYPFTVDSMGNVTLTTAGVLDYETTPGHQKTFQATVTDSNGMTATATIVVQITDDYEPTPPSFTLGTYNFNVHETATAGTIAGTVLATTGASPSTITYSGGTSPFTVNAAGQVVLSTANVLDYETTTNHTISFTVTATDFFGLSSTATVIIHLLDDNEKPTLDSIQDFNLEVGDLLMISPVGHDVDAGDTLTYTAGGQVGLQGHVEYYSEAMLADNGVPLGSFRFVPGVNDAGHTYQESITVHDYAGLTETRYFTITVAAIVPGQISTTQTNYTINEDTNWSSADISVAPAQQVRNPFGELTSDEMSSLADWILTNHAPFYVGAGSTPESFRLFYDHNELEGDSTWTIPLRYTTYVHGPIEAVTHIDYDDVAVDVVSKQITIHIQEVNQTPNLVPISVIPDHPCEVTVLVGSELAVPLEAFDSDVPTQSLGFRLENIPVGTPNGLTIVNVVNSPDSYGQEHATGTLFWPAGATTAPGTYSVLVVAFDNYGGTSSQPVTIHVVYPPPLPPEFPVTVYNFNLHELATVGTGVGTLSAWMDTNAGSNSLTFSGSSGPFTVNSNGSIVLNAAGSAINYETITNHQISFTATVIDQHGLTDTATVVVHILDDDEAPTLDHINNFTLQVGSTLLIQPGRSDPDIDDTPTYSAGGDVDFDVHTVYFGEGSSWDNGVPLGAFRYVPHIGDAGHTYTAYVTVTDEGGLTDTQEFTITVSPVTPAQIDVSGTTFDINENDDWSLTLSATAAQALFEPDQFWSTGNSSDPTLWQPLSPAAPFRLVGTDDPNEVRIVFIPGEVNYTSDWQLPIHLVTTVNHPGINSPSPSVEIVDEQSVTITVHVHEINNPPWVTLSGPYVIAQDMSLLVNDFEAADSDLPTQALTWSLDSSSLAAGMTIDAQSGVFEWTPGMSRTPGIYQVHVSVSDGYDVTTGTFVITLKAANTTPVLSVLDQTARVGEELHVPLHATDADTLDTLTYELAGTLLPGMAIQHVGAAWTLVWTPGAEYSNANVHASVKVTDDGLPNKSATTAFLIHVQPPNRTPWVTGDINPVAYVGVAYTSTLVAHDLDENDEQNLVVSVVDGPAGLIATITPPPSNDPTQHATLTLHWTPAAATIGTVVAVNLRVTDAHGAAYDVPTLHIAVQPDPANHAPVLNFDPPLNYNVPVPATDPATQIYYLGRGETKQVQLSFTLPPELLPKTDIVFLVDDSGSMSTELDWISHINPQTGQIEGMVPELSAKLAELGLDDNQFTVLSFREVASYLAAHDRGYSVTVLGPNGEVVSHKTVDNHDWGSILVGAQYPDPMLSDFVLPNDGDYRVVIDDYQLGQDPALVDDDLSYQFTLDNTPTVVHQGTLLWDTIVKGSIDGPGDVVDYPIAITQAGYYYLDSLTNRSDLGWTLTRPDDSIVAARKFSESERMADGTAFRSLWLDSGTYHLKVAAREFAAHGSYSLRWIDLSAAPAVAGETATLAKLRSGNGTAAFTVASVAGEQLSISIANGDAPEYVDVRMRLIDPLGRMVLDQAVTADAVHYIARLNGTYTLLFDGAITAVRPATYLTFTVDHQLYTPPTFASAPDLAWDSPISANSFETVVRKFHVDEQMPLWLNLSGYGLWSWTLHGPAGTLVSFPTIYGDQNAIRDVFTPGDYYIEFSNKNPDPYSLTVNKQEITSDDEPLVAGETLALTSSWTTKVIPLQLIAGQKYALSTTATGGDYAPLWSLVSPTGEVVPVSQNSMPGMDASSWPNWTADRSGTWLLVSNGANTLGSGQSLTLGLVAVEDSFEPLTLDEVTSATFSGPNQIQQYDITLADTGLLAFDALSSRYDLNWMLTDASGTVIGARNFNTSDGTRLATTKPRAQILSAGHYTLTVSSSSSVGGSYQFAVRDLLATTDTISATTSASGSLSQARELHAWRWTPDADVGDEVTLNLENWTSVSKANVRVIDTFGRQWISTDLEEGQTAHFTLPYETDFFVLLEADIYDQTVDTDYELSLSTTTPSPTDPPSTISGTSDSVISGTLSSSSRTALYEFAELSAGTYFVDGIKALTANSSTGQSTIGSIQWQALSVTGAILAQGTWGNSSAPGTGINSNPDDRPNADGMLEVPAGTYRIQLHSDTVASPLNYQFRLSTVDPSSATPGTFSGQIMQGTQASIYHFSGTAGQHFRFEVNPWGTAEEIAERADRLYPVQGNAEEDGVTAVLKALQGLDFRPGSSRQLVLVTDESRSIQDPSATVSRLVSELKKQHVILHSVLNNPLRADLPGDNVLDQQHDYTDAQFTHNPFAEFLYEPVGLYHDVNEAVPHGSVLLGTDATGGSFLIQPDGGVQPADASSVVTLDDLIDIAYRDDFARSRGVNEGGIIRDFMGAAMNYYDDYWATINSQYGDPALASGGSIWDLNQLRKDPYNVIINGDNYEDPMDPTHGGTQVHYDPAKSFSNAFSQMIQRSIANSLPFSLVSSTINAPYQVLSTSYANGVVTFNVEFQGDGHNYDFNLQVVNTDTGSVDPETHPFQLIATYVTQALATDADGDPLTYSLVGDTHGATLNPQTGAFQWDPVGLNIADGNYTFTTQVSDGRGGTDQKTWTVLVGPAEDNNRVPHGTALLEITAPIDAQMAITVGNVVSDPDGDPLVFTIDPSQLTEPLPDGWKMNRLTGVITWTPTYDYLRQEAYEFPVTVSDGRGGTVQQLVRIRVVDSDVFTNVEPSVALSVPAELRSFSTYVFPVSAYDPNGDALTYTVVTMPDDMTWDAQRHQFAWRPTEDQVGWQLLLIRVSDGHGGTVTVSRTLNVLSSNRRPKFDSTPVDAGPAFAGQTWTYLAHATDPDGDLNLRYSIDGEAQAKGAHINPATGELTWLFPEIDVYTVIITVTDSWGGQDAQVVHIPAQEMPPPNGAPVFLSQPPGVATVGEEYRWVFDVEDPDLDPVTLGLDAESRRRGMTIENGVLIWTNPVKGSYSVSLTVWDGHQQQATLNYTLKVTAQHPPEFRNQPNTTAYVGQSWIYSVYVVDPDEEYVSLSLSSEPVGMDFDPNNPYLLEWTPTAVGTVSFNIIATDQRGAQTTKPVVLNVLDWDPEASPEVAPEFQSQPIGPGYVGTEWSYLVLARDLNHDALTFDLVSGPGGNNGMRLEELTSEELDTLDLPDGVEARILRWTAPISGNFWVELKVTDSSNLSNDQGFELPIATRNSPPRDLSGAFDDLYIGLPWQYQILPFDPDGDVVTVTTMEIRQGGTAVPGAEIDANNRVTWTPDAVGEYALHLVLADGRGGEYETDITLHVHDATAEIASWDNPKVCSVPMNPPIAGQPWGFQLIAVDNTTPPEGMRVVLRPGSTLPHGLHVEEDGRIWWEVVPYDAGGFSALELRIIDRNNLQTDYTLPIRIIAQNLRPEFEAPLVAPPAYLGQSWTWDMVVNDPDPDNPAVLNVVVDSDSATAGVYVDSTEQDGEGKWHVVLKWDSPSSSRPITVTVYDREIDLSEFEGNIDKLPPVATATAGFVLQVADLPLLGDLRFNSHPATTFIPVGGTWHYTPQVGTSASTLVSATITYDSDIENLDWDADTGTFTWEPTLLTNGTVTITASYGDPEDTVEQTFVLSSYTPYRLNEPPLFKSTGLPGHLERDREFTAVVQATDPNGDPLRYSLDRTAIDSGMAIDSRTGVLTWTPHVSGNVSFTVTVTDGELSATQTYQLRVDPNAAPLITSSPDTVYELFDAVDEDLALSYNYAVTVDEPNAHDTLTWTLVGPAWLEFDAVNQVLHNKSGVTVEPGRYTVQLKVSDDHGATDTQSFEIHTYNPHENAPPTADITFRTTVPADQRLTHQFKAVDPDGDQVSFSLADGHPAGMSISPQGLLVWSPHLPDGEDSLEVSFSVILLDERNATVTLDPITVTITRERVNHEPVIDTTPAPRKFAFAKVEYVYQAVATDLDQDTVYWGFINSPEGLTVDPYTGRVTGTLPIAAVGHDIPIVLAAYDLYGGMDTLEWTIHVKAANDGPRFGELAANMIAIDEEYRVDVDVTDPEEGVITLQIVSGPDGLDVVPNTLQLLAAADTLEPGNYPVELEAEDEYGVTTHYTYTLFVYDPALNRAPVFDSSPTSTIWFVGDASSYTPHANDDNTSAITYGLGVVPAGATWNGSALTWTPTLSNIGYYTLNFTASDGQYERVQTIKIQVRDNHAPTIPAVSNTSRTAGQTFVLPLTITDSDGDQISSIVLDADSLAAGLVWDALTQAIRWNIDPGATDQGAHPVVLTATDEFGKWSTREFTITVNADSNDPVLDVKVSPNPAQTNHSIGFSLTATDNVKVATTSVTLTGFTPTGGSFTTLDEDVDFNEFGKGSYLPTAKGTYYFHVVATDVNGNDTAQDINVSVKDNLSPPKVEIISPQQNGTIYAPLVIMGTIGDTIDGISSWQLTLTSKDDPNFERILASYDSTITGYTPAQINRGALAELDTTFLANGMYTLTLTATDGLTSDPSTATVTSTFEVRGGLKLGNFTFGATDLSINTPGIPITVSRTYDTLLAGRDLDFGYGWKWDLGEPQLDITYSDTSLTTFDGNYTPFRDGTRVVVTLPDGTHQGFTFRPYPVIRNGYGLSLGVTEFKPYFEPDPGVLSYLELDQDITLVQINGQSNSEYLIENAQGESSPYAFNPAVSESHNNFVLYTATGTRYGIDPNGSGHTWIEDRKGNRVEYIPNGSETIIRHHNINLTNETQTEVHVIFEDGHISQVIDPLGHAITYQYSAGELISVTDRMGNVTHYNYLEEGDPGYATGAPDPHYLKSIVDPLGRTVTTAVYQSSGRLDSTSDPAGVASTYTYNVQQRAATITTAGQEITLQADDRGNLKQQNTPLGTTLKTYNSQGKVISETQVVGAPDGNSSQKDGLTVRYNYDIYGNPLSQTDIHGHSVSLQYDTHGNVTHSVDIYGNATELKYDSHGNATEIAAGGQTSYLTYDSWGNVLTARQGENGPVSTNSYDASGRLVQTTDVNGRVTFYSYATFDDGENQIGTRNAPTRISFYVSESVTTGSSTSTIQVEVFTEREYDANDRVVRSAQGLKRPGTNQLLRSETLTHYNAAGWVDSTTSRTYDPDGLTYREIVTERKVDIRGSVVETRTTAPALEGASEPIITIQQNVYDSLGRVVYQTESFRVADDGTLLGNSLSATHTTYDEATGQVIATEQLDGISIAISGPDEYGVYTSSLTSSGTSRDLYPSTTEYQNDRVTRTTDAYQLATEYTYDRFGQTTQVRREARDTNGDVVWFVSRSYFDSFGRAAYQTDEYLEGTTDPVLGSQTLYDAEGRGYETRRLKGLSISITEDGTAQVTSVGETVTYSKSTFDSAGRIIASRSNDGLITNFEYDAITGRRLATIGPAVLADSVGLRLVGDPLVRLRSETHYNGQGQIDNETTNLVQLPDGSIINSWKVVTSYEFDGYGRVTKTTRDGYGINDLGQLVVLVSTSTEVESLDDGRTVVETDPLGHSKTMRYDVQGRLVSVELPAVADPNDLDGDNLHHPIYTYEYDESGNLTKITDPNGHITTFTFYANGRQWTRTLPNGETEYAYYDERGRTDYQVSFEGVVTQYIYDDTAFGQGRVSEQRFFPSLGAFNDGEGDPAEVWQYSYDVFGRQVAVTQQVTVITETTTTTTTTTFNTQYDSQGQVVRLNSQQGTLSYEYDSQGRKTRTYIGDSSNPTEDWRYRYDALGRLSEVQIVRRNGAAVDISWSAMGIQPEVTRYHYDLAGNIDWQDEATGAQTDYTYDALQRLTQIAHYSAGDFADPDDGDLLSKFVYTLLADGTRAKLDETLYSNGLTSGMYWIHNTYDWTYDDLNRLTDEAFTTDYDTYFTSGQTPTRGDRPLASYHDHFTFDLAGNRLSKTTDMGVRQSPSAFSFDGIPEETLTYVYDTNDRLNQESLDYTDTEQSDTLTLYTYSGTQQTGKTVQNVDPAEEAESPWISKSIFAWDLQGKLGQVTQQGYNSLGTQISTASTSYSYAPSGDRVGSLTAESVSVATYGGGAETRERTTSTSYLVDPDNFTGYSQVVKESITATTTIDDVDTVATREIISTVGLDVVAQSFSGSITPLDDTDAMGGQSGSTYIGTVSLLYDGHGSTRQLSVMATIWGLYDSRNWVIQGYNYDAYGQMLGNTAVGAVTSLLYSGEQFDQRAAMQYLRARYYNSSSGRFVGLDSYRGSQLDPQSLHKYLYTHDNPISGVDPTGQMEGLAGQLAGLSIATLASGLGTGAVFSAANGAFWDGFMLGSVTMASILLSGGILSGAFVPGALLAIGTGTGFQSLAMLAKTSTQVIRSVPPYELKEAREYALLASACYRGSDPQQVGLWKRRLVFDHKEIPGYRAVLYEKAGTGELVMAWAGTDDAIMSGELSDWQANTAQGLFGASTQYLAAMEDAEKVLRDNGNSGKSIQFVGHSLGGGLASAAALQYNIPATTFNAAGVNRTTAPLAMAKQLVTAYRVQGEFLSTAQDAGMIGWLGPDGVGNTYYLPGTSTDGISRHGMADVITGIDKLFASLYPRTL